MIITEKGYRFESTGREFLDHGGEGLSLSLSGYVQCGYNSRLDFYDAEQEEYTYELSVEEKKEIAEFMIEEWKKFGGII